MKTLLCSSMVMATAVMAASVDPELAGGTASAAFTTAFPPSIRTVAVISPASRPSPKPIKKAIAQLRASGIVVKEGQWIFDKEHKKGATGASLAKRKADFMRAWQDPEVDLILCTRGGSGAQHLIKALDWEELRKTPKKLIGFSNITMLTSAMLAKKVGHPYAGPTLGRLASGTPDSRESFRLAMEEKPQQPIRLVPLRGGDCSGGIYAGHLVMLARIEKSADFRVDPAGRIVFIECVNQTPKALETAWNVLLENGFFREVKAVVFGHFSKIKPPEAVEGLLKKFAGTVSCPVYCGFPYGHEPAIRTLDFEAHAEIKDDVLTIR